MSFTWAKGRQLQGIAKDGLNASYTYDENGLRLSKTVNGVTTKIFRTNGQMVGMNMSDGKDMTFLLDGDGKVYGVHYDHYSFDQKKTETYYFAFNAQGDVIGIYEFYGKVIATYDYDEWGNCTVNVLCEDNNGHAVDSPDHIAQVNPFRYRGYFYDAETGFYYLNSRYYDPGTGRFVNADAVISGTGESVHGYNMFAYGFNNPVNLSDEDGNWPKWATKVLIGAAVIAAAAIVTVATAGAGAGTLVAAVHCVALGALKGAVVGAAVGAATGAAKGAISHRVRNKTWKGAGKAALEKGATGFMTGAITGAITGGKNSNACFIAGTAVLAASGAVAIETIVAGDLVWSENPDTGEKELKRVVQTFVNETDELVHVYVNGETIVTTPEHPFYVPNKGWTGAIQLRAGDILVLQNGKYVVVEKIQHEILERPIKVYNFEVEDFHTYYVGDSFVLVHNVCGVRNTPNQDAVIKLAKEYKSGISRTDANTLVGWAKEYGLNSHYPTTHSGRSGIWSTVEHIKIFNVHIPIVE